MFFSTNTKAFKSISLILACSILLVSCYTTQYSPLQNEYNAQFTGKTYAEIVEKVGPPDRVVPDGQGGEIMVYESKKQRGYAINGSVNLLESKNQTSIYIDENKVCYKVKSDDVKTREVFDPGKTLGLGFTILAGALIIVGLLLDSESD